MLQIFLTCFMSFDPELIRLFFIEAPCTSREVKALRVLFTSTLVIAATWKAGANALSSAHIDFPDV